MKGLITRDYKLSAVLTIIGGFLEAYTYITRDGIFANAQTGNIARVGIFVAAGDFKTAFRFFIPVIAFMLGVTLSMRLKAWQQTHSANCLHWQQTTILLEMILLAAVGFIPLDRYEVPATVTVAFVCALQVESFRRFDDNVFASTMCTGNLRSATENLNHYFAIKDRAYLRKSLAYYGIDLIFLIGVAIGYFVTARFRQRAVWCCSALLGFLFIGLFFMKDDG